MDIMFLLYNKGSLRCLIVVVAILSSSSSTGVAAEGEVNKLPVIYAVNAGGDRFMDSHGIVYQKDPSTQGVASDFGRRLNIDRSNSHDEALYQTERYSQNTFGYDIPIREDGEYVLVLKFSEVYFQNAGQKIFDVLLNSNHLIVQDLDIFAYVGFAAAHDEIVPFKVSNNGKKLVVGQHSSDINRGKIKLEFLKGHADNPKINAFYVIKGTIDDIPILPPPQGLEYGGDEEEEDEIYGDDEEDIRYSRSDLGSESLRLPVGGGKGKIRSGVPSQDPWENEPLAVIYMPVFGSIAASILAFLLLRFVTDKL